MHFGVSSDGIFKSSVHRLLWALAIEKLTAWHRLKWGAFSNLLPSVRAKGVFHSLDPVIWAFLEEPFAFSSSQVPDFAEGEWWCFCTTKLFWILINDWHVLVLGEKVSLELLLCEIIVFRMACEEFLHIYFIYSWYPSSSLFMCPKCNYKTFP